jgi:hypothetical protein
MSERDISGAWGCTWGETHALEPVLALGTPMQNAILHNCVAACKRQLKIVYNLQP